jgi:nitrogen fixation/metabolism regulation signal transduction histidine kinase
MRRPASTSFSFLASIVFLFAIFLVFVLILTNQFLVDFLQNNQLVFGPVLFLSILFIVVLVVLLVISVVRLVMDLRSGVFGVQYKLRLVAFFIAVSLMSGAPTFLLTANLLRNAFDVWFIRDTTTSLDIGVHMAMLYHQDKSSSLMDLSRSELLPVLLKGAVEDPEKVFGRLQSLNKSVSAMQVFGSEGPALCSAGDQRLWLDRGGLSALALDQVNPGLQGDVSVLRTVNYLGEARGAGERRVVLSIRLLDNIEKESNFISNTQRRLLDFARLPMSFPWLVFGVYLLFFIPILLIAMMASFYLADEVIRPLVQLEHAVNRVAQGDYSTRLLTRKSDAMSQFVASFNDMVGELEHSRNDIKQSERLQTWQDIAQRMAHEIKNPLTPIKLSAERILRKYHQGSEDFPRILEEGVGTIIQEVGAISGLLTEFRDFARLPQPVFGEVNLRELVHNTWQMYEGNSGVKLDVGALSADLAIRLDRGQMMQVFKNLFQNAIDAIGPQGGTIWVRSFLMNRMGQHVIRIQLQDSGCGIESDKLREIFNPYFTTKKHGSGLGLAIVEKIILDHGGRIWAESQIGLGTSFFIDLPTAAGSTAT